MVVTKSISRFARNTLDCLKYIRQLKNKNIPVFFKKEAINTLDAKGEVLLTIMVSLAQQESLFRAESTSLASTDWDDPLERRILAQTAIVVFHIPEEFACSCEYF